MPSSVLYLILIVPFLLHAAGVSLAEPSEAERIFRKAVEAQGKFGSDQLSDIHIRFRGSAREQERSTTVVREYWYRSRDRSFRIKTAPQVRLQETSQRGVHEKRFWETDKKGKLFWLAPGNRDDRKVIRKIQEEREDFERIVRMLLLARNEDGQSRIRIAAGSPRFLDRDFPPELRSILPERATREYHVLRLERGKEPPLELFVDSQEFVVRKAVQYHSAQPDQPEWFYYFGPFRRDEATGLQLPVYFSAHDGLPVDAKSRDATAVATGSLKITINAGVDATLLPPGTLKKKVG